MEKGTLYDYNLQFFAEGAGSDDDASSTDGTGESNGDSSDGDRGIDPEAFAAIIAEKDKKLEELEAEMKKVKKSNAELLLKVSAGSRKAEVPIEQTIIDFCDVRKPVNRQQ